MFIKDIVHLLRYNASFIVILRSILKKNVTVDNAGIVAFDANIRFQPLSRLKYFYMIARFS